MPSTTEKQITSKKSVHKTPASPEFASRLFSANLSDSPLLANCGDVFGHCHDDELHENVFMDLISWHRWDEPGSPETVLYYVDNYSSNLINDVTFAAGTWSDVWFSQEQETVKFRLVYGGQLSRNPGVKDWYNMIGWGIPPDDENPAMVYLWGSGQRVYECDMVFNYLKPFAPHSNPPGFPTDKFCIRNSATHELGHWVRLYDVDANNAQAYDHYTMCNAPPRPVNTHWQENLACEDKYALWYTYNEMPWSSAPPLRKLALGSKSKGRYFK